MRILISGAGIAGLTLSYCLQRAGGHEITLVERSPALRDEGYMIDFFGSGYDAAERLGLLPELERIHYPIARLVFLDSRGREKFSIAYRTARRLFDGRHFNFMRGELERVLYSRVRGLVEPRFGVTVEALLQDGATVGARCSDGSEGVYDIVVGADGIHSKVRKLAFGEELGYTRFLGYHTATFILTGPAPLLPTRDAFYTMTAPGRQVGLYPVRGDRLAAFFVHRSDERIADFSCEAATEELRRIYGEMGGVVPEILARIDPQTLYFDEVAQIEMLEWSRGRITLVGDACLCVSLLAGQGASLAMAGAYVLGEEITKSVLGLPGVLKEYERRVRPGVERIQRAGRRIARWFVPEGRFAQSLWDVVTRMAGWPIAWRVVKASMASESILRP